jgi:hypothetical protein
MSDSGASERRERCDAKKRGGDGTCRLPAGHGTDHVGRGYCRRHGGNTPAQETAARNGEVTDAVLAFGLRRDIAAADALVEELHRCAGAVDRIERHMAARILEDPAWEHDREGRAWWVRYDIERERMVKVADTCERLGLIDRQTRVLEQAGEQLATVIRGVVTALGHDLSDPSVQRVVRAQLAAVDGTEGAAA